MREVEIVGLRKEREKHFLQENGEMIAKVYSNPIHFKKGNKYEEIDNTLIKEKDYYKNKNNDYVVQFMENTNNLLMKMIKDNHFLEIKLNNQNNTVSKVLDKKVIYQEILPNIDLEYLVLPTKVKENIILKNNNINKISFLIETNLELVLDNNKIKAINKDKPIFTFEPIFMTDKKKKVSYNNFYQLEKEKDVYTLTLILDEEWLNQALFPVVIDPTVTNSNQEQSVYDTYIYPNDTGIDKNSHNILKAGVESLNGTDVINRSLIKFDLPTIGTGSQVISASLLLNSYGKLDDPYPRNNTVDIHRVITNWDEETANWVNMNDKFDSKLENYAVVNRSLMTYNEDDETFEILMLRNIEVDLTDLVKKWYSEFPNYGVMIKDHNEVYKGVDEYPAFFSSIQTSLAPTLIITYRNQNGLENYMNYMSQGYTNINTYNGNLVGEFLLGRTVSEKNSISLGLIYNTNDVILNYNYGLGLGYKFNYHQTIEEEVIQEITYLKYTDEDGTIHYFLEEIDENEASTGVFIDEDGLNLSIIKTEVGYTMIDKYGNQLLFNTIDNIGYLSTITDVDGNVVQIIYENNKIVKVIDSNNEEINISYVDTNIVVSSKDDTVTLSYQDSKLISITNILGTVYLIYNDKSLIETITDISGLKLKYEYYNQIPHRIKKVSQYGLNDTLGQSFEVGYSHNSTTIKDNKNRVQTMTFNNIGNLISTSSLTESINLKEAYSVSSGYLETDYPDNQYKNKLLTSTIPIKYVNNLLNNTSFENSEINFVTEKDQLILSTEYMNNGFQSLKATSSFYQEVNLEKGKYYTFSAYIKNNEEIILSLSYDNAIKEERILSSNEFKRSDITIYYPEDATSDLKIRFILSDNTTIYVDDIQLEEGTVANHYNMISNSDFSLGFSDWNVSAFEHSEIDGMGPTEEAETTKIDTNKWLSIVSIDNNNNKALKIAMDSHRESIVSKTFSIKGKAGDIYEVSFWYKNEGLTGIDLYDSIQNSVNVYFHFTEESDMGTGILMPNKLISKCEWQYYRFSFPAMLDYDSITLEFNQRMNINNMYITNISLFKDLREVNCDYDIEGNLIYMSNLSNSESKLNYDTNNQLIKMTDAQGKNLRYEYDNLNQNRVINGISETGINNLIKYDCYGNPISTKIVHKTNMDIISGLYSIRVKGTNKYLRNINKAIVLIASDCEHDLWNIKKLENNYCTINHNVINNSYITATSNQVVLTSNNSTKSMFKLIKQDNGSYHFQVYYDEIIVGEDGITEDEDTITETESVKYLKVDNNNLVISEMIEGDSSFEFYIETEEDEFIESSAEYTEDGKFIKSVLDTNLRKISYNINPINGLLNAVTNSKDITTNYTYDNKNRLIKIKQNDKEINYMYNSNNLISKIIDDEKEYNFIYNEFLNIKEIKIGNDITLVTNTYEENNGNLISSTYGNNQIINYTYDNFDRVVSINKSNDTYKYHYDNEGSLVKVEANNDTYKYIYDLSKKLSEYRYNNFRITYIYDTCDNIVGKDYSIDNIINSINHTLNKEDDIIKTEFDNNNINYNYDKLGRIISRNINDQYTTSYTYVTNGKRTSTLFDSINNNNDIYNYKYDELNNITHIYHNDILKNEYSYDLYNQLIEEKNYLDNEIIRYTYDNYGNILNRKVLDANNYDVILEDKYEYNNSKWLDQLTKFNEKNITYDNIGNALTIGNDTLTWINGRQLNSYNNITYKYNNEGIRTSKVVNGVETEYYLEGTSIIFEKRDNDVIYYIRNGIDNLIGFKYNNNIYYYVKNLQNDIIGILNSNYDLIVKYRYDGWGNILSITDSDGNNITDTNHIGIINPFRYRSYYYDTETNLYYLNSRYYSPMLKRFLNADGILGANRDMMAYNLYIYCSNNPIMGIDSNGQGWLKDAWNGVCNFIGGIGKKIKKGFNNLCNTVKKSLDFVANLVSVGVTKTVTEKRTRSYNGLEYVETVEYVKTEHKLNENALIHLNLNLGDKFLDTNVSVSVKTKDSENGAYIGFSGAGVESSRKVGDKTVIHSAGIDGLKIYQGVSTETKIAGPAVYGTSVNHGVDLTVPIFAVATIYVIATCPITIPTGAVQALKYAMMAA